jgi:hypothetical protein
MFDGENLLSLEQEMLFCCCTLRLQDRIAQQALALQQQEWRSRRLRQRTAHALRAAQRDTCGAAPHSSIEQLKMLFGRQLFIITDFFIFHTKQNTPNMSRI